MSLSNLRRPKETVITRADRAREMRQWDVAAQLYGQALDRNPCNPPIWVQYGHALKEAGRVEAGEAAYRRAITYDPRGADPHLQLGHVLKLQGKREDAQRAYLQALMLDPSLSDLKPVVRAMARWRSLRPTATAEDARGVGKPASSPWPIAPRRPGNGGGRRGSMAAPKRLLHNLTGQTMGGSRDTRRRSRKARRRIAS